MARIIQCDICGEECKEFSRYRFIQCRILGNYEKDICYDCIDRIRKEIKVGKGGKHEGN